MVNATWIFGGIIGGRRGSGGRKLSCFEKLLCGVLAASSLTMLYFAFSTKERMGIAKGTRIRSTNSGLSVDYCCHRADSGHSTVRNRTGLPPERTGKQMLFLNASSLPTDSRILILVETSYSNLGKQIRFIFNSLKFPHRVEVLRKNLPLLTTIMKGKFSLIIFENYYKYLNMNSWNKQLLDKYCKDYSVGVIGFLLSRQDKDYERARVLGFPLEIYQKQRISRIWFNHTSTVCDITRCRGELTDLPVFDNWLTFSSQHSTYESVLFGSTYSALNKTKGGPIMILDNGRFDGISRILVGFDFRFWLIKLLFVDAVRFLLAGRLPFTFTRFLQVDIDDIFVGPRGFRMIEEDIQALLSAQERVQKRIPGFVYHLGFSGKYYKNGDPLENEADKYLLQKAAHFVWFPHMWKHNHPQLLNESHLENLMAHNKHFAEKHHLPLRWGYAVAPHHAGVYPVHEPLFEAWKKVWNTQVTSTEEYPHQKPASLRRGFTYKDIMVLPRQTCGLYTHTVFLDSYPGGRAKLDENIFGGDLFFTFVFSPYLIFMTHSTNYANDRLALYTFESVIRFVQCWTRLELKSISPLEMASRYFSDFPDERLPVWGNPCLDKKHLEIWSANKRCDQLPRALIIGPQKSGTTALYTFLGMHPGVKSNLPSQKSFEEVQFFSGRNYKNGLDWYMSFFESPPETINTTVPYFFEKSAAYFDAELAPKRVKALIPDARLIAILISPAKRAYSWYQHMRSHEDPTAMSHSFREVLETSSRGDELRKLRQHCLTPGMYSHHVEAWLEYFSYRQLLLLDGEEVKTNPVGVMDSVQRFLGLDPILDYSSMLKFNSEKGFFCRVVSTAAKETKMKCLGRSKGRNYPPMDSEDRKWLLRFFRPYNVALHRLLTKYGFALPAWLQEELEEAV